MVIVKIMKIEKRLDKFKQNKFYYVLYFEWITGQVKGTILNSKAVTYWKNKKGVNKIKIGDVIDVVQVGFNKFQIKDWVEYEFKDEVLTSAVRINKKEGK